MQRCKSFKSIVSAILAIVMLMAISIPAFATEEILGEAEVFQTSMTDEYGGIVPYDAGILGEINCINEGLSNSKSWGVTPDKGHKLWIRINNNYQFSGPLKIEIIKKGSLLPSKTIHVSVGVANAQYELISNCNGEKYTIKVTNLTADTMARFYMVLYQTQYI